MKLRRLPLLLICIASTLYGTGSLPKELAGYGLQGISIYDDHRLGFSARYENPKNEEKFDIYLYRGNYSDLDTGVSDAVKNEFHQTILQIQALEKRGYYSNVTEPESGTGTLTLDGNEVEFLWGMIQFKQTAKEQQITNVRSLETRSSYIFLTSYKGRILKIRYTIAIDSLEVGMQTFTDILNEFERKFTRPDLLGK